VHARVPEGQEPLVALVTARRTGKILFNHSEDTHDDRFWALALSVYAAEISPPPASKPLAKTID